jgi:hypothetical protein
VVVFARGVRTDRPIEEPFDRHVPVPTYVGMA